jgi:hypothetical protein
MGESNGIAPLLGGWVMPKAYSGACVSACLRKWKVGLAVTTEKFAASASTAIIYPLIGIKSRTPPSTPTLASTNTLEHF